MPNNLLNDTGVCRAAPGLVVEFEVNESAFCKVHCCSAVFKCSGRVQWYIAVVECNGKVQW